MKKNYSSPAFEMHVISTSDIMSSSYSWGGIFEMEPKSKDIPDPADM